MLPPLRERRDDLPLLTEHLIDRLNSRLGLRVQTIAPAAQERLRLHDWPGNVRELENVLQRAMILTDSGTIEVGHLPGTIGMSRAMPYQDTAPDLPEKFEDVVARATERVERTLIENTLALCGGNRTKTAAALGMSRRTLFSKLKKLSVVAETDVDEKP